MAGRHHLALDSLRYCSAPMVNQSDLPFRLQTVKHGATSTWTQMYLAADLNDDQDTLETLLKSLERGLNSSDNLIQDPTNPLYGQSAPQVVQLAGNDIDGLVSAARKVSHLTDAIDLNLGCPQRHAEVGGYGAYLLAKQHWPLVTSLVEGLAHSVDVPVTTKIRLTVPKEQTTALAVDLSRAGSSLITVHPRFASSVRRRKGIADLSMVNEVINVLDKEGLLRSSENPNGDTAVISNGNVRCWSDIPANLAKTGASGVMVGESLLENPALFSPSLIGSTSSSVLPDSAADMVSEYLDIRNTCEALGSPVKVAKQHVHAILCSPPPSLSLQDDVDAVHHKQMPSDFHRLRAILSSKIKSIETEADLSSFQKQLRAANDPAPGLTNVF